MQVHKLITLKVEGEWPIPDNSPEGVSCPIFVEEQGQIDSIKVAVDIRHPFIGDLEVNLISPLDEIVNLHNRQGFNSDDLVKTFEGDVFAPFIGTDISGAWTLQVIDHATRDNGHLAGWTLEVNCFVEEAQIEPTILAETVILETTPMAVAEVPEIVAEEAAIEEMEIVAEVPEEEETDENEEEIEGDDDEIGVEEEEDEVEEGEEEEDDEVEEEEEKIVSEEMDENEPTEIVVTEMPTMEIVAETVADISEETEPVIVEPIVSETVAVENETIEPDDLRKIEGIGPKISQILNENGILTFAQLAAAPLENLQEILDTAGLSNHQPDTWSRQAEMAADGQWDELREWQDVLMGGVEQD